MTCTECGCDCSTQRPAWEGPYPAYSLAELFRLDPLLADKVEVDAEEECWVWVGASSVSMDRTRSARYGRVKRRRIVWLIHRWVYRLMIGEIPPGYQVHHECGRSLCCNPRHLSAVFGPDHTMHHNEEARRDASAA